MLTKRKPLYNEDAGWSLRCLRYDNYVMVEISIFSYSKNSNN